MASTSAPPVFHVFRFQVKVADFPLGGAQGATSEMSFAECSGLEATMEPKTIKEGGRNYGSAQRTGSTTFATVMLKRGVCADRGMWTIFNTIATGKFAGRLQVTISLLDAKMNPLITWQLTQAMPVKFKFADLNARGTEIGIEELHFVHEGLFAM